MGSSVIELSPSSAIMLYLFLALGTLLGGWLFQHFINRKKKVNVSSERLIVCEFCHFVYLDRIERQVTQCPQCQCYNKK